MSTTVTYKGKTLTTVKDTTMILNTAGTWMEDNITLTDDTGDEQYLYQDANGYICISDTLPPSTALKILSVIPKSEITLAVLVDSLGNTLVDSSGNEIITVSKGENNG